MDQYSPEREVAEYCQRKELTETQAAAFVIWFFTGVWGAICGADWMFTWWGFWLVGVPYGILLEVLVTVGYKLNRQRSSD